MPLKHISLVANNVAVVQTGRRGLAPHPEEPRKRRLEG
jgi:hypothetical protein